MIKLLLGFLLFTFLYSAEENGASSAALIKQKIEVKELKQELNSFYNKKEKEYQERKQELETILTKIEKEKKEIESIRDENRELLANIKGEVDNKTANIYNKMKSKVAADIFNQMIVDGNIEGVFDIILRLKEAKVTELMKFLSPKNASILTKMLQEYKINNKNEG